MAIDIYKERLAFEAVEAGSELRRAQFEDDEYANPCVQRCWETWLAAKRHAAQVAEECTLCNGQGALDVLGGICPHCNGSKVEPTAPAAPWGASNVQKVHATIKESDSGASFNTAEFDAMVEKGTAVWSKVPDNWLEEHRNGPSGASVEGDCPLTDEELSDPEYTRAYIESCNHSFCLVNDALQAARKRISELEGDAARFRTAIALDDNAETLYAAVMNHAGNEGAIRAEFDSAMSPNKEG